MLFTSIEFLLLFLPIAVIGYYALPPWRNLRNVWLLIASLLFYAWGEPWFVLAMIAIIAVNWFMALRVRGNKPILILTIALDLSVLFVFKYLNFVTGGLTHFVLPIGISFFTFQAISYVVDVYRGIPAQKNPLKVALYIALFPQLIAGPIVRYSSICDQIDHRHTTRQQFADGMLRFLIGFNKKVLLANIFAETADRIFALSVPDAGLAWLGAIGYTFQIYFDFSGYSDMAIGLGKMFGFEFQENFNYPYLSRSASDFWRRWHISLGSWFRDYVYFPMGGSRVATRGRLVWNLSVVWLLTGIWHGANWTFILWGVLWGVLIIGEKLTKRELSWPVTMLTVVLSWVLFRSPDLAHAVGYYASMFGGHAWWSPMAAFEWREGAVTLVLGAACAMSVFRKFTMTTAAFLVQIVLFAVSVSQLAMESHNPFIYFNF